MDDTQQSRVSDAAATRKRRSSILKSQRPPRTPFSELEFTVATPTDTAKSRRVSFSRRTGVAEFVTNEATTTWKNFYEEHNKSLESSGNESGAHAPRPPVGHIGKRIFDQQFQEVEAVDFTSTLDNHSNRNVNMSMNNVNFTQQLASLECTGDEKLAMPQQNFEMSAFTDHHSKIFGDDLAAPTMGEMSGQIPVDFSAVQTLLDVKDDLDEIEKDLERAQNNVVCPGPFTGRKSMSEYIEVDLNATHISVRNDDDDNMSITDTIRSPKVQDVSKLNNSSSQNSKKSSFSKDWVADKENIALNPYATPKESTNFAINDESNKVLVFDGKRLTVQSDKEADKILKTSKDDFKPNMSKEAKPHQRKTIVLNVNDDLPNFVDNPLSTSVGMMGSASFKHSVMYDDDDISITQPLATKVDSMPVKNVTVVNENDIGDISLTQAVNNVILPSNREKRRTIVYENDNCDISMTQALPVQIIGTDPDRLIPERRRTILFENNTEDISITQAIPVNIITNDKSDISVDRNKTVVFGNVTADISMTQVVPANLILSNDDKKNVPPGQSEKRKTIVFENDNCDISMTQVLPSKIIGENKPEPGRRRTILYDNDVGDISVTQAIPSKILLSENKEVVNKTVVYDDYMDTDISMTQAVPSNLLLQAKDGNSEKVEGEKRKTIVFENEDCDISVTRALPSKIIIPITKPQTETRQSILHANIIAHNKTELEEKASNTTGLESSPSHVSESQVIPTSLILSVIDVGDKNKTAIAETELGDISMTRAIPTNIILSHDSNNEQRKTVVYGDGSGNISVTQTLPAKILVPDSCEKRQTISAENRTDMSVAPGVLVNVLIVNNATEIRKPIMYDSEVQNSLLDKTNLKDTAVDSESVSHTSDVPDDAMLPEKDKTVTENQNEVIEIINDLPENGALVLTSPIRALEDKSRAISTEDEENASTDDRIYIIRDIENETQTNGVEESESAKLRNEVPRIEHSPLSLEYDEADKAVTADLSQHFSALKKALKKQMSPKKCQKDKELSSKLENKTLKSDSKEKSPTKILKTSFKDVNDSNESIKSDEKEKSPSKNKTFEDANDTNELLEMLSSLTDRRSSIEPEQPVAKIEADEPRRLSVAPNRMSIVLSREDLLNNISMAQAALQRSIESDESIDDTTPDTPDEVTPPKKTVRVSNEVVKKLQFEEDESASDHSVKGDLQGSLLRKSAIREASFEQDTASKGKVIPSYLKDVSDGIKALMHDLVKPNMDTIPFQSTEGRAGLKREPSTCSNQIQANLVTSSQIDLDTNPTSVTDSVADFDKLSESTSNKSHSVKSSSNTDSKTESENLAGALPKRLFRAKRYSGSPPAEDRVIMFDHHNPLNNILLGPIDFSEVHKYTPPIPDDVSKDTVSTNESQLLQNSKEKVATTEMRFVGNVSVAHRRQVAGESGDKLDAHSLSSDSSKPVSMDESAAMRVCEVKDIQVNTVIAMKGNKELLAASSSLTLVDDALARNKFDVDLEAEIEPSDLPDNVDRNSPVEVIYHNEEKDSVEKLELDYTSNEDTDSESKFATKAKKRNYSSTKRDKHKYCTVSSLDVTPKPILKMQKLSTSPHSFKIPDVVVSPKLDTANYDMDCAQPQKLPAEKDDSFRSLSSMDVESSEEKVVPKKRSPRKSKSPKSKKPGTDVTVQQLIAEYRTRSDVDQDTLNKQIIQVLSQSNSSTAPNTVSVDNAQNSPKSVDIVSSFTSSKNQNEPEANSVDASKTPSTVSRNRSMSWHPELSESSSDLSACESGVNVVAKIDMLPFMGSHECEWEASGVDTWSFRLLHGRLRLSVRLEHRHDNATRTRVRADTPVKHIALETAHKDKKSSVASLCVGFAAESMRYLVGSGAARAGDVPALLRRCAGVARVALRWGRAMHEARLHLAYSFTPGGGLALKVANIPLRSVWEVTMRLELVVEEASEAPWPRACGVHVERVVSDVRVPDAALRRLLAPLPRDWGHVPRAVWKIFRYLKSKNLEVELMAPMT